LEKGFTTAKVLYVRVNRSGSIQAIMGEYELHICIAPLAIQTGLFGSRDDGMSSYYVGFVYTAALPGLSSCGFRYTWNTWDKYV